MALYLVQHGKNLPKEIDPDKGLSPEGVSEVKETAGVAARHGLKINAVRHSGKKRAHQTAEIYAQTLGGDIPVEKSDGLGPLDDVTAYASGIKDDEDVMLVGHLPFMEKMASYLITGNPEKPVLKFQKGGVVCLKKDADADAWVIGGALFPNPGECFQ